MYIPTEWTVRETFLRDDDLSPVFPSVLENVDQSRAPFRLFVKKMQTKEPLFKPISLTALSNQRKMKQYCSNRKLTLVTDSNHIQDSAALPLVNCDDVGESLNRIINAIQEYEIDCAIFYSKYEAGCAMNPDTPWFKKEVPNTFTTTSAGDTIQLLSHMSSPESMVATIEKKTWFGPLEIFGIVAIVVVSIAGLSCVLYWLHRESRHHPVPKNALRKIPLVRVRATESSDASQDNVPVKLESEVCSHEDGSMHKQPVVISEEATFCPHSVCKKNVVTEQIQIPIPSEYSNPGDASWASEHIVEPPPPPPPIINSVQTSIDDFNAEACQERETKKRSFLLRDFGLHESRHRGSRPQSHQPPQTNAFASEHPASASIAREFRRMSHHTAHPHLSWRIRRDLVDFHLTPKKNIEEYTMNAKEACPICLEDFKTGDMLRKLPCNHYFHASCIDPWFRKSSSKCPICRGDILEHHRLRHGKRPRSTSI